MTKDDFDSFLKLGGLAILIAIAIWICGCATPPSLSTTEAEIDAKIAELSRPAKDPGAVIYNATDKVYELRPDIYKSAVRDGIIKDIQDEKMKDMSDYLADHPPMTFGQKLKHFGIGFLVGYLLGIGSGIYISQ